MCVCFHSLPLPFFIDFSSKHICTFCERMHTMVAFFGCMASMASGVVGYLGRLFTRKVGLIVSGNTRTSRVFWMEFFDDVLHLHQFFLFSLSLFCSSVLRYSEETQRQKLTATDLGVHRQKQNHSKACHALVSLGAAKRLCRPSRRFVLSRMYVYHTCQIPTRTVTRRKQEAVPSKTRAVVHTVERKTLCKPSHLRDANANKIVPSATRGDDVPCCVFTRTLRETGNRGSFFRGILFGHVAGRR